jgi:ribosomal protein S30
MWSATLTRAGRLRGQTVAWRATEAERATPATQNRDLLDVNFLVWSWCGNGAPLREHLLGEVIFAGQFIFGELDMPQMNLW